MKKNLLYLVALVLLGGIVWYYSNDGAAINESRIDRRDFSIANIKEVDKIVISSKSPSTVSLTRQNDGSWLVDGKYLARQTNVALLLKTMARMEVKNPISKLMEPQVIKKMAVQSNKVEVFKDGELDKTFYVGHNTPDNLGTYMLLKGATKPYALHLPGHNGYISSRFYTNPYLWRDRLVFDIDNLDIESISLDYGQGDKLGFSIEKSGEKYIFKNHLNEVVAVDPIKVHAYLASFRDIRHEGFILNSDPMNGEKLETQVPYFDLKIKEKGKEPIALRAYYKMNKMLDEVDNPFVEPDVDRMYARLKGDYIIIQYYNFNKILMSNIAFK